jgi:hypothetical protein
VKRWLKAHPRFHLHFTPTSASWLNMVERFFAEITRNRIRRGTFKSVAELKSAILEYLENHNADPKPFVWTKSAGEILEKVARAKQVLESVRRVQAGLQSFLSMRRIDARRKKARALRLRFSQSLASLRQRLSQAMERSTIHRLGKTANPLTRSERLMISTLRCGRTLASALANCGP